MLDWVLGASIFARSVGLDYSRPIETGMSQFKIHLRDLDRGPKRYVFPILSAWVESQLRDWQVGPRDAAPDATVGELQVEAQLQGDDVVIVRGKVHALLVGECARCAEPAMLSAKGDVVTLFSPTKGKDDEDDDTDRMTYSGETLLLDDMAREHLVLDIPMQLLCREDCPGVEIPGQKEALAAFEAAKVAASRTGLGALSALAKTARKGNA